MMPCALPKMEIDVDQLINGLGRMRPQLGIDDEEFGFLANYLQNPVLRNLITIHETIVSQSSPELARQPVLSTAEDIAFEVMGEIQMKGLTTPEAVELFRLLQSPHILNLLSAHDSVAQRDFLPRLPDIPCDPLDGDFEETVKIVQLVKSNEALGATIKADEKTGAIVIARVMHGGAADRSGLIHVGDEVLEVNDIDVAEKSPNDVLKILTQAQGTITFKLIPADTRHPQRESKLRMRALYDYRAADDQHIPCREAGLDFRRGDVLHIVGQDDIYWWQARLEGDTSMRSGLIPSRALQERRILATRSASTSDAGGGPVATGCMSHSSVAGSGSQSPRTRRIMYDTADCDEWDRDQVATYEEVARLYPRPGVQRPLVLVGPPGVGRSELQRRLVATAPDKYRGVIPYTSRPQRPGESNGVDYHFVSRADMEDGVARGRFIEYGEFRGHFYGTAFESIMSIINSGHVCVLCPHYQALKMIRSAEMRPYIVFVRPPSLQRLKETRTQAGAVTTTDSTGPRGFTDEEFRQMVLSAERLEQHYSHLFDHVLVNDNLTSALAQLIRTASRVESEPMWVPASWVQ